MLITSFTQGRHAMSGTDSSEFQRLRHSRTGVAFVMFLNILVFFLVTEHRVHLDPAMPYVLLAGSIVMFFFMHGARARRRHSCATPSPDPEPQ